MKLSGIKIDSFLNRPDASVIFVLFFGPDEGLARDSAKRLMRAAGLDENDPFASSTLTNDALKGEPGKLTDEAQSIGLFSARRLIRIRPAEDSVAAAVELYLSAQPAPTSLVIAEAGELSPRSKLRALAEAHAQAVAIGCYPAEGRALENWLEAELRAAKLEIEKEALLLLANQMPPDRMAQRGELLKLICYMQGHESKIHVGDIQALMADAGAAELERMVQGLGDGDVHLCMKSICRLFADATAPIALLRAAQRHFLKLLEIAAAMERGESADAAVKSLRPPVFFKEQPILIRQAQRWRRALILRVLAALASAEAHTKLTGIPAETLTAEKLLRIARR